MATPEFDVVLEALKIGPSAIFGLMWWLERSERVDLSKKVHEMGREVVVAITETRAALATLGNIFNGTTGRK